jgi:hypothetical protein
MVCLSKTAVHPASHNWGMDKRELARRLGKVYAVVADNGRLGIFSWVVALEWICVPLGSATVIGSWLVDPSPHGTWEVVRNDQCYRCPRLL